MKLVVLGLLLLSACGGGDDDAGGGSDHAEVVMPNAPDAIFAVRARDGSWQVTSHGTDAVEVAPFIEDRYTVAIGCTLAGHQAVSVYDLTIAEVPTLTYDGLCANPSATLDVRLMGQAGNEDSMVYWGPVGGYATVGSDWPLEVPLGKHDLLAARGVAAVDRIIAVRDLEVTGTTVQNIDLEAPDAIVPVRTPRPGTSFTQLVTAAGTRVSLGINQDYVATIPESQLAPGDVMEFDISGGGGGGNYAQRFQTAAYYTRTLPAAFTLPDPAPQPEPVAMATRTMTTVAASVQWAAQPNAVAYHFQADAWSVHASPSVFEASPRFELPDLTGVDPMLVHTNLSTNQEWSVAATVSGTTEEAFGAGGVHEAVYRSAGWEGDIQLR